MRGFQRSIVRAAAICLPVYLVFMAAVGVGVVYVPGFKDSINDTHFVWFFFGFHFAVMAVFFVALIITGRDMRRRQFTWKRNLTWTLLYCTGIGWYAYLYRHGFKPRTNGTPRPPGDE